MTADTRYHRDDGEARSVRMRGTMLWFNAEKGFGFIRTEAGERLLVERGGFLAGELPAGRCAGLEVAFDRQDAGGEPRAVSVAFPAREEPRRARLRRARGASPF